ncbi:stress response translation initiation inhibitor YciH [Oceanimonas pelagia]|uniref:Stress response translation initiation inhibitor YciH n=1 Tax=Oceanimonas pelagia TaxID=3028314 RepID=A0AA50KLV9_9GAMM|nr:stress response translation initiation inhibitor YciH [Oceanimonas pelagia]WMC09287.1 stress response translation initiation inhibitor YciH [Oceanimonas pelagia]
MSNIVFSTDPGWQPEQNGGKPDQGPFPDDGIIRLRRETKGRKGAGVICVYGIGPGQVGEVAKKLKKQLGTGGAVKKGVIEIQGDRLAQIRQWLEKAGFTVKQVGG